LIINILLLILVIFLLLIHWIASIMR